jgi:hypothetical protein
MIGTKFACSVFCKIQEYSFEHTQCCSQHGDEKLRLAKIWMALSWKKAKY